MWETPAALKTSCPVANCSKLADSPAVLCSGNVGLCPAVSSMNITTVGLRLLQGGALIVDGFWGSIQHGFWASWAACCSGIAALLLPRVAGP